MEPILLDVPSEVSTARLLLRTPRAGDGVLVAASVRLSLAELKPWLPWAKEEDTERDCEMWARRVAAEFLLRQQFHYAIFDHAGQHVGNIGAMSPNWKVQSTEIGYWLRTDRCGNGLMTEAVVGLGGMLADVLKMQRIIIRCDNRNPASGRVAERAGYQLEGVARSDSLDRDGKHRDTRVYSKITQIPDVE